MSTRLINKLKNIKKEKNMQSFKVCDMVYETSDYSLFRNLDQNRDVTRMRRDRLIESFKEKEVKNPIVVNKNMEIIDGQGRFEAKKELGLPVQFIIDESADIDDCRRMNLYNSSWDVSDFVRSYASGGNENYVRLENLQKELSLSARRTLIFAELCSLSGGQFTKKVVYNGSLKFTEDDEAVVRKNVSMYEDVVNALCLKVNGIKRNGQFLRALIVCFSTKGYNHSKMVSNCSVFKERFSMMSTIEDNLKQFSRIYNYRAKTREKIYFEDYMRNKGSNVFDYKDCFTLSEKHCENVKTLV